MAEDCGRISNVPFMVFSLWRSKLELPHAFFSFGNLWLKTGQLVCVAGEKDLVLQASSNPGGWLLGHHGGQRRGRHGQHGLAHHVCGLQGPSGPGLPGSAAILWCPDADAEERWDRSVHVCVSSQQTTCVKRWSYSPSCVFLSGELLSSGDRREVEIRGCSIWSVELIRDRLCKLVRERDAQSCGVTSAIIDFYLWPYAKQHHKEMAHIPIHHTRCIYYWAAGRHAALAPCDTAKPVSVPDLCSVGFSFTARQRCRSSQTL